MSETSFVHEPDCRDLTGEPEWQPDERMGVERRVCMCGAETRPLRTLRIDPATQSPEPSTSAALHHPGCAASPEAVRVERNLRDGGWRSHCAVCDSTTLFWREDIWDVPRRGNPVLVTRRGNLLYRYRTVADEEREQQRQRPRVVAGLRRD